MKHAALVVAGALISALAVPAYAQQQKESHADAKAIRDLAEANMAEIEAGKVAAEKARSPDVKEFARHMVDDHTKMLEEVQALAKSKGVDLPKEPRRLHQSDVSKLDKASGDQFDKDYMNMMVADHSATVTEVETIARDSKDADVRAAAQKALPDIEKHLQMAEQIQGGGASHGSSKSSGR